MANGSSRRSNRRGLDRTDLELLGNDSEYDSELLAQDSVVAEVLASRDPETFALLRQQEQEKKRDVAKKAAILGGADLLATGLQAALSPTLRYAAGEAQRIGAQRMSGTLGQEAFRETMQAGRGAVGAASGQAARGLLGAQAAMGGASLKQMKGVIDAASRQAREAEGKLVAMASEAGRQQAGQDIKKLESIQQFFGQTLDQAMGSLVGAGAKFAELAGAMEAYKASKDLPAIAAELKSAFPDKSDAERVALLRKFEGMGDEERASLIAELKGENQPAQPVIGEQPAGAPTAPATQAPAGAAAAIEADTAPAAPQSREVPGAGGYRYRQDPDGTVTIIGAPSTRQDVIGNSYAATNSIGQAITNEIGAYQAPQAAPQAQSAAGQSLVDSVRQAQSDVSPDGPPQGEFTPQSVVEKREVARGDDATEQEIIDRGLNAEQADALRRERAAALASQRAQGQAPVSAAAQPGGFLGAATNQQAIARQPDHYTSAAEFQQVGPTGEFVKMNLGDRVVYFNRETSRIHQAEGERLQPGIDSFGLNQLNPAMRQSIGGKLQQYQAFITDSQQDVERPMTRMTDEQRDAMRPTQTGGPPPAPLPRLNQDPAIRQPGLPAPQGLDIGLTPGQQVIASQPQEERVVDDIVDAMLPGATEAQVAAGTAAFQQGQAAQTPAPAPAPVPASNFQMTAELEQLLLDSWNRLPVEQKQRITNNEGYTRWKAQQLQSLIEGMQ